MSRSYKHTACCIMCACKSNKVIANRRVRRHSTELYNGMSYKKLFNSWDIVDWKDLRSFDKCKSLSLNEYNKFYVRK